MSARLRATQRSREYGSFLLICADRALDCVGDAIGVFVNLVEFAAFVQKANFRFGTRVAQKKATLAGELTFYFLAQFNDFTQFLDRRFRVDHTVALRLGMC